MMARAQYCRECRSPLVDDFDNGEVVCTRCGIVVADHMAYSGPEFSNSENMMTRASGQLIYSQHDLGITTDIDGRNTDYGGKPIKHSMVSNITHLRQWQQRIRVNGTRDRRTTSVLTKISDLCSTMNLPKNVLDTASLEYRNLDSRVDLKNKSVVAMSAAVLYIACKKCGVIRSIEDMVNVMCTGRDARTKVKLAGRYYRTLVLAVGSKHNTLMPIEKYISKISNNIRGEVRMERLALQLANKTQNHAIMEGKDPSGVAAAYLYISAILLGRDIVQQDIAEAGNVTDVTVRSRCKEILDKYDITITVRPLALR